MKPLLDGLFIHFQLYHLNIFQPAFDATQCGPMLVADRYSSSQAQCTEPCSTARQPSCRASSTMGQTGLARRKC